MSCYRFKYITIGDDSGGVSTPTISLANYYQEWLLENGSSLIWTQNGGQVPSDLDSRFRLIRDGNELNKAEYTINTSTATTLGYSTINLTYGGVPNANYWATAEFINGV